MKKPSRHQRHEKLAAAAFIVTLILAMGAFYFIWQQQAHYGRTVEGLQRFWEAQWRREHPGEPVPVVVYQQPEIQTCCCKTLRKETPYQIYAEVPKDSSDAERIDECRRGCEKGGKFGNIGNCKWIV